MSPGIFSVTSDSSMCPGVDSASNNDYHDNRGGKGGRCVRLTTYHLHVPTVNKSGNLNLLEPLGPVQACNGTALYSHNTGSLFYPPITTSHSLQVFQSVCDVWPVTSFYFCDTHCSTRSTHRLLFCVTTIQSPSVLLFMFHFTEPLPYPHALLIQATGDDAVEDADGSLTYG